MHIIYRLLSVQKPLVRMHSESYIEYFAYLFICVYVYMHWSIYMIHVFPLGHVYTKHSFDYENLSFDMKREQANTHGSL